MHVALVGTYRPTQCGIATFTADVEASLHAAGVDVTMVPVIPEGGIDHEHDPGQCGGRIDRDDPASYVDAARRVNLLGVDIVLIQHEFGIFGGDAGEHIMQFVDALERPHAVTLHTVLHRFSPSQLRVVQRLCADASVVTVFTESARDLVLRERLAPPRRIQVVPHGAPSQLYEPVDVPAARRELGLPATGSVMSTFGLLSPGKGIEGGIHAVDLLRSEHPDLRYVIAGCTHPEIVRRDGERYRHSLHALVEDLDLTERVIFIDRFLELDELAALLGLSDVVCTPYRGEEQAVSGVLTFALAAGCPVVSTPYRYARDVLADGAGALVPFDDDERLAQAIHLMLDPQTGQHTRLAARRAAAQMSWPAVGHTLRDVLTGALRPQPALRIPARKPRHQSFEELGTSHLATLCDDTAILQHAQFTVPRHEDGYCVDDASRALPILDHLATTGDSSWHPRVARMLAFVRAAHDEHGRMHNFMTWQRQWLDAPNVGDHVGRTIWGLGELVERGGPNAEAAQALLRPLARAVSPEWPIKTLAYSLVGLAAASSSVPETADAIGRCLDTLHEWRPQSGRWQWCQPRLDYDNARLPEALLRVGHLTGDETLVDRGATMLSWYDQLCRQGDHYRFPGHRGLSDARELNWSGDEQPLEATALADAHDAWYLASTDTSAIASASLAWSWFTGNNRLGESLVDWVSGASYDGLCTHGVNRNAGAESTIALHRCSLTVQSLLRFQIDVTSSNGSLSVRA